MIALLRKGREFGYSKLEVSVARALELGCTDVAAICHLLMTDELQHGIAETVAVETLSVNVRCRLL